MNEILLSEPPEDFAMDCRLFYGGFDIEGFDDFLRSPGWDSEAAQDNRADLTRKRQRAFDAYRQGNKDALEGWLNFLFCAWRHIQRDEYVVPLARYAKPFRDNAAKRRQGGPIRRAIARELKKNRGLKNRELWDILAAKPPNGWEACDNPRGKYFAGPKGKNMGYPRFSAVCLEERKKLAR